MLIKDLPPKLRELAELRRSEYTKRNNILNARAYIDNAFTWNDTQEGMAFWSSVDDGKWPEKYDEVPEKQRSEADLVLPTFPLPQRQSLTELKELLAKEPLTLEVTRHKGERYNTGKLRYDLVHPEAHEGMVKVLTAGSIKYAERNWERGMAWSTVLASMKRHIAAFEKGEDFDPETGELHVNHIACNAHFLSAYYRIYPQGDDRPHKYLQTPRIGLDIDEVLCDWVGDWTEYRGLERPTSWSFDSGMVAEFEKMKAEGRLDEFYMNLKPLASPADLNFEPHCYITSRPVSSEVTAAWLKKHGFPARPVYTTDEALSKVDIALREKLDIFVDDGFHNFQALNNAKVCCFLMDAPHNQRYDVGYRRLKSLKEL